ncbi:MAG: DUF488 family protein, N3 subclade, partial [Acidimicrobiales bacterium]
DGEDHRVVRLHLTPEGAERLDELSALHLEELERFGPPLPGTWEDLGPVRTSPDHRGHDTPAGKQKRPSITVAVARVYDEVGKDPSPRVLVDRLWPRGLARADAPFEAWAKAVAPSPALRKWYQHAPGRFQEFEKRYRRELATPPSRQAVETLRDKATRKETVLLTATKDLTVSHATILAEVVVAG